MARRSLRLRFSLVGDLMELFTKYQPDGLGDFIASLFTGFIPGGLLLGLLLGLLGFGAFFLFNLLVDMLRR